MQDLMHLSEIRRLVDHEPFQPLRISLSDGTEHVVENPNLIFLARHAITLYRIEEGEEFPDTAAYFDPIHITRVETMAAE